MSNKPKLPGPVRPRHNTSWDNEGPLNPDDFGTTDTGGNDPTVNPGSGSTEDPTNPDPHSIGLNEHNPYEPIPTPNPLPTGTGGGGGPANRTTSALPSSPYSGLNDLLNRLMAQSSHRDDSQRQAVMARYNSLMDQYSKPVDKNDPSIKGAVDAFQGQSDRAVRMYREQAAERAHAEGVGSGAFDAQIGNATMQGGLAVGNLESKMMTEELTQRRQNLSDMLNQSSQFINAGDQMRLTEEMHAIDAALQSIQIKNQHEVGMAGVGATNRGLDLGNQHFYDDLAYRQANDAANRDDSDLARLLQQLFGGG